MHHSLHNCNTLCIYEEAVTKQLKMHAHMTQQGCRCGGGGGDDDDDDYDDDDDDNDDDDDDDDDDDVNHAILTHTSET